MIPASKYEETRPRIPNTGVGLASVGPDEAVRRNKSVRPTEFRSIGGPDTSRSKATAILHALPILP